MRVYSPVFGLFFWIYLKKLEIFGFVQASKTVSKKKKPS